MPLMGFEGEEPSCGVCGDSPIGPQHHVIGGRYVGFLPTVSRAFRAGQVIPVSFFINQTVIPGVDRVTFGLCAMTQHWSDVSWECLQDGAAVEVVGWGDTYLPLSPGLHTVYLKLPRNFTCRRCVLQWRWQTSYLADRRQCSRQPWLRTCYLPVQYVNCADVSIRLAPAYANPWSQYLLLAAAGS